MVFSERQKVWFLFALALIVRLIVLPYAQMIEADGVSRLFAAEDVIRHRGSVSCMQWPSGQIYFLSLGQLISGERLWGPVILSLLMGAASIIPFYLFTRNIFNKDGAFFAALLFTFNPLIFRHSFTALSEIYHVFFSLMAIWTLSQGIRNPDRKMFWTILAGIFATIACGGRFEAWVMAGLLGIVLLILREWKMFFVFGILASLYPIGWMLFCHYKTGHYFVSLEMVQFQNFVVSKVNHNLDAVTMARRTIFFPLSWIIALTPVAVLLILAQLPRLVRSWKTEPLRILYFSLFIFFLVFFIFESRDGSLADQHRYSVTLIILSLPVFALWFENPKRKKIKIITSLLIAALMIPSAYVCEKIPWYWLSFGSNDRSGAINLIISGTYPEFRPVPRIHPPEVDEFAKAARGAYHPGEGFFIDFWNWDPCYYVQLYSPYEAKLYMAGDFEKHNGEYGRFREFFQKYPKGVISLFDYSSLSREIHCHGNLAEIDSVPGGLLLSSVYEKEHLRVFKYQYISPEETVVQRQKLNLVPPLFTFEKDYIYFRNSLDPYTTAGLWRESFTKNESFENAVERVAHWQAQNELDNLKKINSDSIK